MAKIKAYVISCSSDGEMDSRKLFVWGEMGAARWLPETESEANKRILICQKETKCKICDAEVHEIELKRTTETKMILFARQKIEKTKGPSDVYHQLYYQIHKAEILEKQRIRYHKNKEEMRERNKKNHEKQKTFKI